MGTFLQVIGGIMLALGSVAWVLTMTNAIANCDATLFCLVGATFLTGGCIIEAIKYAVKDLLKSKG